MWFKTQFQNLMAWLVAHPVVKNFLDWAIKSVLVASASYIMTALNPAQGSTFTLAGLLAVLSVTIKAVIQHGFDVFILNGQPATPQAVLALKRSAPVVPVGSPSNQGGSSMKSLAFLFLIFSMLAGNCFAWDIPDQSIGLTLKANEAIMANGLKVTAGNMQVVNPSVTGEDDLVLVPTGSLGFGVGSPTSSYGYSGAFDLVFGHVSQGTTSGSDVLTPYFGIGAALYVDMGPWISSGLKSPVLGDGGFNVLGPSIQGLVPSFEITWNFQTGEEKKIVSFTAPFSILDSLITKVSQL